MADMTGHIVKSFEQELGRLRTLITDMGGLVERQVTLACSAVLERDADHIRRFANCVPPGLVARQVALACVAVLERDGEAANAAVESDPQVDGLEREVEQFVIRLLALRQPMAQDLRHIVAALKITGELERIGDYAKNVAKRSIVLDQFNMSSTLTGFAHMSRLVQENLKAIIDAFGDNDDAVMLALGRPTRQGARQVHDPHLGVAVERARAAVAENLLAART